MPINIDANLTIIIVNWNTKEMLKTCLESIIENQDNQKVKIIVVDNNSKDGSREMVKTLFPEVKLINSGSNMGFGRANNLALHQANTSLILFLNPDTSVLKGTLDEMIDFMISHPTVGAIGCKMISPPDRKKTLGPDGEAHTLGMQWVPSPLKILFKMLFLSDRLIQKFKKHLPYHDPNKSGYVTFLPGACLMVKREVLERIGNFDERFFMYGEDYDLCHRIREAGWQLYYMSEVKIMHHVGGASRKTRNQFSALMMCQSISQLMEKYHGQVGKFLYRIVIFFGSSLRLFILTNLIIMSKILALHGDKSYKEALSKYIHMLKWSVNLEKAKVEE